MSLYAAIASELSGLRAEAESRMVSRATVRRRTGDTIVNPDGYEVEEWAIVHEGLACRLGGSERGGSSTRTVRVGDSEVQVAVRVAHFPADTSGLSDGDLVEITSGENAGVVLRLVESAWQDQATARRVPVVETTRPAEWA